MTTERAAGLRAPYSVRRIEEAKVVERIMRMFDRLNEEAGEGERDAAWDRDQLPGPREAVQSIAAIFKRIEESLP